MVSDNIALPLAGKRVLLVDDEELVRIITQDMFESFGADIVCAEAAAGTMALLDEGHYFDVVVCDWLLAGAGKHLLAQQIAHRFPGIPLLVITGLGASENQIDTFHRLHKPFRPDQLLKAVLEAINDGASNSG